MGEFFKPWRRRCGVVTLVMAYVFATGWVRSLSFFEGITCPTGTRMAFGLISNNQHVLFIAGLFGGRDSYIVAGFPELDWDSRQVEELSEIYAESDMSWRFGWRYFGVHYSQRQGATFCIFPYWSVTIPLTLISLWLLITKSRKSTQSKISEPVSNEGA